MKILSRAMAALTVAALTAILLVVSGGTATADSHRGFQPPTTVQYLGADCTQIDEHSWSVTYNWVVQGGRYANLGNAQHQTDRDLVRFGGRRIIRTTTTLTGFGDLDVDHPEVEAWYVHNIAPIRTRSDVMTWRSRVRTVSVNLDCR